MLFSNLKGCCCALENQDPYQHMLSIDPSHEHETAFNTLTLILNTLQFKRKIQQQQQNVLKEQKNKKLKLPQFLAFRHPVVTQVMQNCSPCVQILYVFCPFYVAFLMMCYSLLSLQL